MAARPRRIFEKRGDGYGPIEGLVIGGRDRVRVRVAIQTLFEGFYHETCFYKTAAC